MRRSLLVVAAIAAGSAAVLAAVPKTERSGFPVAGIPALKHSDAGDLTRWKPGTIKVYLDPSLERIDRHASDAVLRAFGSWMESERDLPPLEFVHTEQRLGARQDGKSTISYAPIEYSGHRRDLAITVTYTDSASGEILEADIVLNSEHSFGILEEARMAAEDDGSSCDGDRSDCRDGYDLESIVAHEIGHFWGLGEDREESSATMYFCTGRCEMHKRSLQRSDYTPLGQLYAGGTVTTTEPSGCGKSSSSKSWSD